MAKLKLILLLAVVACLLSESLAGEGRNQRRDPVKNLKDLTLIKKRAKGIAADPSRQKMFLFEHIQEEIFGSKEDGQGHHRMATDTGVSLAGEGRNQRRYLKKNLKDLSLNKKRAKGIAAEPSYFFPCGDHKPSWCELLGNRRMATDTGVNLAREGKNQRRDPEKNLKALKNLSRNKKRAKGTAAEPGVLRCSRSGQKPCWLELYGNRRMATDTGLPGIRGRADFD